MSTATASVADVSRIDVPTENDSRGQTNAGLSQAQCMPMPLPALGTQRIVQGNGTNVGTVISLQCPAKHKLIGGDMVCVMGTNSTQWIGETYCKPLSRYEDLGFRVAVVASIVSSAIILLMSMAFITCCVQDCVKEEKRKKQQRETDLWHREEQIQQQEDRRSRYSHKSRNNNNNNSQEKPLSLWDEHDPALCDKRSCRYHQNDPCGLTVPPSACSFGPAPLLPGCHYDQPLLPQNSSFDQNAGPLPNYVPLQCTGPVPPQYLEPSWTFCQPQNSGLVQNSAGGADLGCHYGGQESSLLLANQSATAESYKDSRNAPYRLYQYEDTPQKRENKLTTSQTCSLF